MTIKRCTAVLTMICLLLIVADYTLKERFNPRMTASAIAEQNNASSTISSPNIPNKTIIKKGKQVKKRQEKDILSLIQAGGFTSTETSASSLLTRLIEEKQSVQSIIILKDNDRFGMLSWVETANAHSLFINIKKALATQFSEQAHNMMDGTLNAGEGGESAIEFITFIDPTLSQQGVYIFRMRSRLFLIESPLENDTFSALITALRAK